MNKTAIFVEGQTEQIFIKELLHQIFGYQSIVISDDKIRGKNIVVSLKSNEESADHLHYEFLLINVGNDERVTSAVIENAANMIRMGYRKILGLRDLYPNNRAQESAIKESIDKIIQGNPHADKLKIFLAIMETEAWFLSDPNLFQKINDQLTVEYIQSELNFNLEDADPQVAFDHPAKIINDIYQLVNLKYRKREGDCYKIAKKIDYDYLYLDARELDKISSFFQFADELVSS